MGLSDCRAADLNFGPEIVDEGMSSSAQQTDIRGWGRTTLLGWSPASDAGTTENGRTERSMFCPSITYCMPLRELGCPS